MSATSTTDRSIEALIAVFASRDEATKAIRALHHLGLEFVEISEEPSPSASEIVHELRNVFYSRKQNVNSTDVADGIAKGAAIGAASGLLFIPVPILGILTTIGGFLGGALIGGMVGVDEALRETRLPDLNNYRDLLAQGKGLVVFPGDEAFRKRVGNELKAMGAESVYQHPPTAHDFRHPATDIPQPLAVTTAANGELPAKN